MIVFELQCSRHHRFEGWFASADDFEHQHAAAEIACPVCADPEIRRVPSARIKRPEKPSRGQVSTQSQPAANPSTPPSPAPTAAKQMTLAAFIDHLLVNSEDVGTRFADEARKIHRGEATRRSIRGQATASETEELLDEGVPVMPLPIPPKDSWQ